MQSDIKTSFNKLKQYIEKEQFKGYDPYDTLLSWVPFHWLGKWGPVLAIQFQKRNPINIRPLLGIPKDKNPKAIGLLLHAYSMLWLKTHDPQYKKQAGELFHWLKENHTPGYSGYCWGYNFPWASPVKYLKSYTPSAVVTGFVVRGLWEYYKINKTGEVQDVITGAAQFIMNDLPHTHFEDGLCISYTPVMKDLCFNASLLGAEVLARAGVLLDNEEYKNTAKNAVNWVINRQKEDGRWNYSIDPDSGNERKQLDFHQGYVLESIHEIKTILDITDEHWDNAIHKGLGFYRKEQFFDNGRSLWRLPKVWPVDIHNQAQGIITFHKLTQYPETYPEFAETILNYTIEHMQHNNKGYFYYKQHKNYTHKIPYMRWSQAWMFLAFSYIK